MSVYHDCFNSLEVNTVNQAFGVLSSPERLKLCGLLEETVGFQINLLRNIRPFKNDHNFNNMRLCYDRCSFNTYSLYSTYRILKSDDIATFFAMIRTVFESFPKMFYCMRHAEDARHMYCCERFFWWSWKQDPDKLEKWKKDGEVEKRFHESGYLETGLYEIKEGFYESVKKPINHKECGKQPVWFREKVYTKDMAKNLEKEYKEYSENIHSTFEPFFVRESTEFALL